MEWVLVEDWLAIFSKNIEQYSRLSFNHFLKYLLFRMTWQQCPYAIAPSFLFVVFRLSTADSGALVFLTFTIAFIYSFGLFKMTQVMVTMSHLQELQIFFPACLGGGFIFECLCLCGGADENDEDSSAALAAATSPVVSETM